MAAYFFKRIVMKQGIDIKQRNLFFLNQEYIRITVGEDQIFDKDCNPVLNEKKEPTFTKGKVFLIRQISVGRYEYFSERLSILLFSLSGIFGKENFIESYEPFKINEQLVLKHASNLLLQRVVYEMLRESCFKRKFYYEMFKLNERDNVFTAILKQPIKLLFWLLNKIHIGMVWKLSFKYFINHIKSQELLSIFFGVLLINVEGPKKKVSQIAREIERFLGVKRLSLQNLFKGYQTKTDKRFISRTGKDGYMELIDTHKLQCQSANIF